MRVSFGSAIAVAILIGVAGIGWAQSGTSTSELHGQKLVEAYCAGCHGIDGNSTDPLNPKIAGQKESYLRAQLQEFKSGARKSDLMSGPAKEISDAQIVELARYFSEQRVKPDAVKDERLAAFGAQIYNVPIRGAPPPCAACHDGRGGSGFGRGGMMGGMGGMMGGQMGMMGNTANVPNLNGQHAAYTVQQLDAFADGTRPATVMGQIARAMRPQDRRAVAEYIAGQH